jgi:glutathione synthase/RimK-type ligase-like ATP-grasp enzyme
MAYLLRRRKLGRTSCREISRLSHGRIQTFRDDMRLPQQAGNTVFRWGCTANAPGNPHIINDAAAIHRVNDKAGFRQLLQAEELCPMTWFAINNGAGNEPKYPCVVRPQFHHQGRKLYVCHSRPELVNAIARCGAGWYASALINKVAEYRVFVVSGRAVCVARKHPGNPGQVAWNVFQGGRFENVNWDNWPLKAVKNSIKAFQLSGLDFGGVDVMVDAAGETYILEINAAPSLTSPYRQECFAKAFEYILAHGKANIPLQEAKGGYTKFIHPAINQNAR